MSALKIAAIGNAKTETIRKMIEASEYGIVAVNENVELTKDENGRQIIRIIDHTGEAAARINGMKELLKAAARRKKLVTGKNGVPEYVVNFNWLVDSVNDAERRQKK